LIVVATEAFTRGLSMTLGASRSERVSQAVAALAIVGSLGAGGCSGGSSPSTVAGATSAAAVAPRYPRAQVAAIARNAVAGLGDHRVRTAWAFRTTRRAATAVLFHGQRVSNPAGLARAYVIVVRGRFVCHICMRFADGHGAPGRVYPANPERAKMPRGRVYAQIWIPGRAITQITLTQHLPRGLSRLGRRVIVPVAAPHVSPALTAVQPESGIGPVRLGASLASLDRAFGPALWKAPVTGGSGTWGTYAYGPVQARAQADAKGRVEFMIIQTAKATIDGHPLSQGFARSRVALHDWKVGFCGGGRSELEVLFHKGDSGIATRVNFEGGRLYSIVIGGAQSMDDLCD
jgi:hypothetical protein